MSSAILWKKIFYGRREYPLRDARIQFVLKIISLFVSCYATVADLWPIYHGQCAIRRLTYNVYIYVFTTIFDTYMRRFLIIRNKKYVYIQVIYPKLHLRAPSDLGWSGVETRDVHVFLCLSTTSRRSEHVPLAEKLSSHRCHSCRTGKDWCKLYRREL